MARYKPCCVPPQNSRRDTCCVGREPREQYRHRVAHRSPLEAAHPRVPHKNFQTAEDVRFIVRCRWRETGSSTSARHEAACRCPPRARSDRRRRRRARLRAVHGARQHNETLGGDYGPMFTHDADPACASESVHLCRPDWPVSVTRTENSMGPRDVACGA
eukprot:Rmarinus@m.15108